MVMEIPTQCPFDLPVRSRAPNSYEPFCSIGFEIDNLKLKLAALKT